MTEKKILKRTLCIVSTLLLAYLICSVVIDRRSNDYYSDTIYTDLTNIPEEDLIITVEDPSIITLTSWDLSDGQLHYTLRGLAPGVTSLTVCQKNNDLSFYSEYYTVAKNLLITNMNNGNFSSCREQTLLMLLFMAGLLGVLIYGYILNSKYLGYSYQSIFYFGFSVWMLSAFLHILSRYLRGADMLGIYSALQTSGEHFMLFSLPFILIFSVALTISNISLIRHESFRFQNALGILLSAVMLGGCIVGLICFSFSFSGSEASMKRIMAILSIYSSFYCLAECFLLGSVICGIFAALHEPALDKDYIIILGCKIRSDGTLYPLIRGRVDRAIAFYNKQLQSTGKNAVFVPSGGQGSDEVISEGEAMKRYLLEQNIPESDILVENKSVNTRQNMQFSKELIEKRTENAKVAFSTTNYHIFRSGIISRQVGFSPDGMGAPTKWYFWPNAYVREMIGMTVYLRKRLILIAIPVVAFFAVINIVF